MNTTRRTTTPQRRNVAATPKRSDPKRSTAARQTTIANRTARAIKHGATQTRPATGRAR